MKSIIQDIYFGNRGIQDTIKMSDEYWKIMGDIDLLCQEFLPTLSQEQKNKFNEISSLTGGLEAESALSHYEEGIKIGFLLAMECMD